MKKIFIILCATIFSIAFANSYDSDRAPINVTSDNNVITEPSVYSDGPTDPITWTTMAPCPSAGRYWAPGYGVIRDTIWYCGGRSPAGSINEIIAFIPGTGTWATSGFPTLLTTRNK